MSLRKLFLCTIFCICLFASCDVTSSADDGVAPAANEQLKELNELLDIYLENAKSFRNYDLVVQHTMMYEPAVKDARFAPFVNFTNYRIVMDWDQERCMMLTHSYDETAQSDSKVHESFQADKFEDGVWTDRGFFFPGRPTVRNTTFALFLRQAAVPMTEMAALRLFPNHYDGPFEQGILAAKKSTEATFRRLPDGTGVRLVKTETSESVTHFDRISMMPVFLACDPKKRSRPVSHSVKYDLKDGVYRPIEIAVKRSTFVPDPDKPKDGSDIFYYDGVGTVKFKWNKFNETDVEFPDDRKLTKSRETWLTMIGIEE